MRRYRQASRRDNLAAWLGLTLAAVMGSIGLMLAAPAKADDVQLYLDALHERGIYHDDGDGTMVQVGQEICDQIGLGRSPLSVAMQVYRSTPPSISAEDAGYMAGAAIGGLCPEYASLVR